MGVAHTVPAAAAAGAEHKDIPVVLALNTRTAAAAVVDNSGFVGVAGIPGAAVGKV